MSYVDQVLDDVRAQLAPDDVVLKEARSAATWSVLPLRVSTGLSGPTVQGR
jgi:hypothetical protein